jgi:hypothetical protein
MPQNAFWKFQYVEIHSMFYCDVLHQLIEGNFIHLLKATAQYLSDRRSFTSFDTMLAIRMKRLPAFSGLELSQNSFFQLSLYTGKVCSNIMKVIVQLLRSSKRTTSFLDNLCKTWDLYIDISYYAKLPSHNWATIRDLKRTIGDFTDRLHLMHGNNPDLTLLNAQKSKFCYPKFHAIGHLVSVRSSGIRSIFSVLMHSKDIFSIGCLYNGDTQTSEAMHSDIKDIWRRSHNHRHNMEGQLLKVHSCHEAMSIFSDGIANDRIPRKRKDCAVS